MYRRRKRSAQDQHADHRDEDDLARHDADGPVHTLRLARDRSLSVQLRQQPHDRHDQRVEDERDDQPVGYRREDAAQRLERRHDAAPAQEQEIKRDPREQDDDHRDGPVYV